MYEEEIASINSEMRFITLELMKLARKEKKSFREVATEFISNVYTLDRMVKESGVKRTVRSRTIAHRNGRARTSR
jgi:chromosome condensin MukBEF ATPase and DNA-binding subunit MukB